MKVVLIASVVSVVISTSGAVSAEASELSAGDARSERPASLLLVQRRASPDTSTPGSTAPGNPVKSRPAYLSQQEQSYAAELRRCETIGEPAERLACKNSVRGKFSEM